MNRQSFIKDLIDVLYGGYMIKTAMDSEDGLKVDEFKANLVII